jgi:PDZ domain-containing protein
VTRQTWTATVSALMFVTLAALAVLIPVPFVTWYPGNSYDTLGDVDDQPMITVSGIQTYPTSGRLDLTTVSVTKAGGDVSLPEAVLAYFLPDRDTLPRDFVYAPGQSVAEANRDEILLMETSQDDAIVAALRAAGRPVTEHPAVASVTVDAPAHTRLLPGDLILSVDGRAVKTVQEVGDLVRAHKVGERVAFTVLRDGDRVEVAVTAAASTVTRGAVAVGITVAPGYEYEPDIAFELGQQIGGPSAGLVFATAIYDKITPGALLDGVHAAGSGTITPSGDVGPVGGLQQKLAAAEEAGATAFLLPAASCANMTGLTTDLTVIKVATLQEGIDALSLLRQPGGAAQVPRCP